MTDQIAGGEHQLRLRVERRGSNGVGPWLHVSIMVGRGLIRLLNFGSLNRELYRRVQREEWEVGHRSFDEPIWVGTSSTREHRGAVGGGLLHRYCRHNRSGPLEQQHPLGCSNIIPWEQTEGAADLGNGGEGVAVMAFGVRVYHFKCVGCAWRCFSHA